MQARLPCKRDEYSLYFYLTTDNYVLSQIEKIRQANDLSIELLLQFRAFIEGNPASIQSYKMRLQDIIIRKSAWIEDVLLRLNYKNVTLVEIPKLEYEYFIHEWIWNKINYLL